MSVVTLLPFFLVFGLVILLAVVSRRRRLTVDARVRREEAFLAALPPPSVASADLNARALEALDVLCARSNSTAGVYVDMKDYFAWRGWNDADVHHIMGRLGGLDFAHQEVSAEHPFSLYRYRATESGVRENMANSGRSAYSSNVSLNQYTTHGNNFAATSLGSGNASLNQSHQGESRNVHLELAQRLREDAADALPVIADTAQSHAQSLEAALAAGDAVARDESVGHIQRFLQTVGSGFQASQQLLSLLGLPG
ncbi:hypothetical protein FKN01_08950 [Streptomyces sp. 130]|uniref:hypothetical protein n=1 Tax=Streptomyces sp. 130 TaxID=2591006 RepID=UPI00117F962F|nr:hypothetical protein [Streptomyces sp. 130]TRV79779.1 hypothetical protein FKN01_08950 [Streptomyces sp. 130]